MDHVDTFSLSLGALVAFTLALLVLSIVLFAIVRTGTSFLQRFQSFGAQRVNGKVSVTGLFEDRDEQPREETAVQNIAINMGDGVDPERIARAFKEDLRRVVNVKTPPDEAS